MTELVACDIEQTLADLERSVGGTRRMGAVLGREVIDALDVLHHALEFAGHPQGLVLWREALYEGTIAPEGRAAIQQMLAFLNEAMANDETQRILEICDCLEVFMRPQSQARGDSSSGLTCVHGQV